MSLNNQQVENVEHILINCLRDKIRNYKPETISMPFHTRLLGKDRMALFSFIQSLNTTFGISIFEPIAKSIAKDNFKVVQSQFTSGSLISSESQSVIQQIINQLENGERIPDKKAEIEEIRRVCQSGQFININPIKVDLFLSTFDDELFLIDLKTAKPNKNDFRSYKRTLLNWVGVTLAQNPYAKVNTLIAIPYNPYEPKPYRRWTINGMIDLDNEINVASEFWDFLGGEGTYEILLTCFEKVGIELSSELDDYFMRFENRH